MNNSPEKPVSAADPKPIDQPAGNTEPNTAANAKPNMTASAESMTGKERLLCVLDGGKPDRVPNAPFIFYNLIDEFYQRSETRALDEGTGGIDYIEKGIELYEHFGFDILLRTANVFEYLTEADDEEGKWRVQEERTGDNNSWSIVTTITTPEKTLRQQKKYHKAAPHEVVEAVTEYFIKDSSDFDQFLSYQPPMRTFDTSQIRRAVDLLGDRGLVAPWAQGAFNSASFYRDVTELVMDPYLDEPFYREMITYFSSRMQNFIRQLTDAGAHMICAGGNVANGITAGPKFFKEHVLPYEIEFTRTIKNMGVYYLYHNCGSAKSLYELYNPINMNVFETLTAPPAGDNDLALAFDTFDHDIVLSGNLDQIDFLIHASPAEVRKKVKEILDIAKPYGNFILAASDYFSEGTPYENIMAYADAAKEFGDY